MPHAVATASIRSRRLAMPSRTTTRQSIAQAIGNTA
jgi:hypothetical protein